MEGEWHAQAIGCSVSPSSEVRIERIRLEHPEHGAAVALTRFGTWAGLLLNSDLGPSDSPHVVRVETTGPAELTWRALPISNSLAHAPTIPVGSEALGLDTPIRREEQDRPVWEPKPRSPFVWQVLNVLELHSIACAPRPEMAKAARYFRDLDHCSNAILLNERVGSTRESCVYRPSFATVIPKAGEALWKSFSERIAGRTPGEHHLLPRPVLLMLSALQSDLIIRHYGSDPDAWAQLAYAYAMFGAGALALRIEPLTPEGSISHRFNNGGPNGPFVFLFAEFALQAIHAGIESHIWKPLLPAFLTCAELYLGNEALSQQMPHVTPSVGPHAETSPTRGQLEGIESVWAKYVGKGTGDASDQLNELARRAFTTSRSEQPAVA
jgi:hypothetical protein